MTRESKWTWVCWDADDQGMFAYVRLIPDCMDTEAAGFAWGFPVGNEKFRLVDDANDFADEIDRFMDMLVESLLCYDINEALWRMKKNVQKHT